ncbi:putative spermidine/putrescine transport system permease protein [Rhizobium sp. NFR07]|uniref:ABC transporter permease n=1 Tax=Rhizobium sp. NFR07 TaxID=1566262 RepID=UPI0008F1FD12|nr:ABC transporter permease [Rhizobium sp. NFR07]SFB31387.1 putative spermidine/putrescine transport system permease protein [Rhizobium sp. NFR07]
MMYDLVSDHPAPRRRKRFRWSRILLAIYVLLFLLFLLAPITAVVAVSFSSANFIALPMPGLSLRWYERIVGYEPFLQSLIVSLEVAAISALAGLVLGVPAALWVARDRGVLARAIMSLMLAPISVPAMLLGFSLLYLLSAMTIGISFLALCITHTVVAIPYVARTVLAVYRSLPVEYEEAAAVLGASRLRILFDIVLPLIKPAIFAGTMFSVLMSFDNLSLSFFFGGAATSTLPVVMLSYMQNQFDPSIAAIATVQMLIAVLALGIVNWIYGIEKLTAA